MRKIVYIASTFSAILLFASCEKDEFQEVYEQQDAVQENKETSNGTLENLEDDLYTGKVFMEERQRHTDANPSDPKDDKDNISVKEVTDRDSEEDGGDDAELN